MLQISGRDNSGVIGHFNCFSNGYAGLLYGITRNGIEIIGMSLENVVLLTELTLLQLVLLLKYREQYVS